MSHPNQFPKKEKLCGEIRISRLFAEGSAFISYPIRMVYRQIDDPTESGVRVLVAVPKKKIRKAVDRNLIKRRIREAYRLNKRALVRGSKNAEISMELALTYVSDQISDYSLIEKKIDQGLNKILKKIQKEDSE